MIRVKRLVVKVDELAGDIGVEICDHGTRAIAVRLGCEGTRNEMNLSVPRSSDGTFLPVGNKLT